MARVGVKWHFLAIGNFDIFKSYPFKYRNLDLYTYITLRRITRVNSERHDYDTDLSGNSDILEWVYDISTSWINLLDSWNDLCMISEMVECCLDEIWTTKLNEKDIYLQTSFPSQGWQGFSLSKFNWNVKQKY